MPRCRWVSLGARVPKQLNHFRVMTLIIDSELNCSTTRPRVGKYSWGGLAITSSSYRRCALQLSMALGHFRCYSSVPPSPWQSSRYIETHTKPSYFLSTNFWSISVVIMSDHHHPCYNRAVFLLMTSLLVPALTSVKPVQTSKYGPMPMVSTHKASHIVSAG